MKRVSKFASALGAASLGVSGMALTAAPPASAAHEPAGPCMVITQSTKLTRNVGPCAGHGIVVAANNITLNLNGFTVFGEKKEAEQVGIYIEGRNGVTVRNGTVTGFDAGVAIEGGNGNTVKNMTVRDNVNDMIEPLDPRSILVNRETGPTPEQMMQIGRVSCLYGDGITTFDSEENTITGNIVVGNGPFAGISMVGESDGNTVSSNTVHENDLLNNGVTDGAGNPIFIDQTRIPNPAPPGPGVPPTIPGPNFGRHTSADTPLAVRPQSMCGATEIGTPGMGRGREVQSIGIRIEGPGADNNLVDRNAVTKGGLVGISTHSYVLVPAGPNVLIGTSNKFNTISRNDVSRTGEDTVTRDSFADGIASLASGPTGTVTRPSDSNTIIRNNSFDNARHGISLGRLSFNMNVERNVVTNNGVNGIWVAGPVAPTLNPSFDPQGAYNNILSRNDGRRNGAEDGFDGSPECGTNSWLANNLREVNQRCVSQGRPGRPGARAAAGTGVDQPSAGMTRSRA